MLRPDVWPGLVSRHPRLHLVALGPSTGPERPPLILPPVDTRSGVARLEAETQQCQARLVGYAASSLAALVAVHGGSVSSSVDDRDTHLLVVQPIAEPSPAARAAVAQLATALAAAAEVGQAAVEQAAKADERLAERRAALLAAATQAAASCAPQPVKSADLIAAVSRQAGGQAAVAALWRRVDAGQLALVAPRWVTGVQLAKRQLLTPTFWQR